MSAEVLAFPVSPRFSDTSARPRLAVGDMIVTCVNANLGLWCAWPVDVIDDDGVVLGVRTPAGKLLGVDRLNCCPEVYGFKARDHQAAPFAALRWQTWRDAGDATLTFALIEVTDAP